MAQKLEMLTDLTKTENALKSGTQYYREVCVDGSWTNFTPEKNTLLAYSKVNGEEEVLVVMNLDNENEIENSITVDKDLSPKNAKMKDILGKAKNYKIEEENGRNFVTVKLKPNHVAVLKIEK